MGPPPAETLKAAPAWAKQALNEHWVEAGRKLTKSQSGASAKLGMVEALIKLHEVHEYSQEVICEVLHYVAASGFGGIASPKSLLDPVKSNRGMIQFEYQLQKMEVEKRGRRDKAPPLPDLLRKQPWQEKYQNPGGRQ